MTRIILRYLNAPLFILLVCIGVAMQTSLFASYPFLYLQPDVVLLAVIWCGLKRDFYEGGILTLIFSHIAEIHSSAPSGLWMISYMSIYLLVRASTRLLVLPNASSVTFLTMALHVIWKLVYFSVIYLMGKHQNQWKHLLVLLFPGAVIEGAASIWIYRWLDRFDWKTYKNERANQMLEDELLLEGEGF